MREICDIVEALAQEPRQAATLATLVDVQGSSYRRPGARMLALSGGLRIGSISGGCLEEDVAERAKQVLLSGRPEVATYDTASENDAAWGLGLGCQGVVRILLEPISSSRPRWLATLAENIRLQRETALATIHADALQEIWGTRLECDLPILPDQRGVFRETIGPLARLIVFGGGDDARPLVSIANQIGWQVTVVDSRRAFATQARFPSARLVVAAAEEITSRVRLDSRVFVTIMTHRYEEDKRLLGILLTQPLTYLGILGPRKRTERLLGELLAEGVDIHPLTKENIYSPVGLDLGGSTPEVVALSILAEMHCRLADRIPVSLRHRLGAIHG